MPDVPKRIKKNIEKPVEVFHSCITSWHESILLTKFLSSSWLLLFEPNPLQRLLLALNSGIIPGGLKIIWNVSEESGSVMRNANVLPAVLSLWYHMILELYPGHDYQYITRNSFWKLQVVVLKDKIPSPDPLLGRTTALVPSPISAQHLSEGEQLYRSYWVWTSRLWAKLH